MASTGGWTAKGSNGITWEGPFYANAFYGDGSNLTNVGSGANTALSNLASVAINTSLISDTDNTDDLGSSAKQWRNLYVHGVGYIDEVEGETFQFDTTSGGLRCRFWLDDSGYPTIKMQSYVSSTWKDIFVLQDANAQGDGYMKFTNNSSSQSVAFTGYGLLNGSDNANLFTYDAANGYIKLGDNAYADTSGNFIAAGYVQAAGGSFYAGSTQGYTGDLNDSTSTKIADVVGGIITAVYY